MIFENWLTRDKNKTAARRKANQMGGIFSVADDFEHFHENRYFECFKAPNLRRLRYAYTESA